MFSPTSSSDFFHTIARKYMPQPTSLQQGTSMPGVPQGLPMGGTPRYTGSYAQGMQQSGPFQGLNYSSSGGPGAGAGQGGFANVPGDWRYWRQRLSGGTPIEAKQSSGDRYANLSSVPFAMGPNPGVAYGGSGY